MLGPTWLVEIVLIEYTTHVLLSGPKIFSLALLIKNWQVYLIAFVMARNRDPRHILGRSVWRMFLPMQKNVSPILRQFCKSEEGPRVSHVNKVVVVNVGDEGDIKEKLN